MPFVRLARKGREKFNGKMGRFQFENGVSVENLSQADAERLGCSCSIVDAETGEQISVLATLQKKRAEQRAVARERKAARKEGKQPEAKAKSKPKVEKSEKDPANEVVAKPNADFTVAQLEEIADKEGLKGIRKFAEPFGIRGKSVVGIIDDLKKLLPEETAE